MGGIAQIASYAMTGAEIRRCTVPRTVSLALEIGQTVREARIKGEQNTAEALIDYFKTSNPSRFSRVLFDGKVEDVLRESSDGWTRGHVDLANDRGSALNISFQNEFSRAILDGDTVALNPDLILILDRETGEAITTETLRYGQRVRVLGVAAVPIMRTPEALKVIGPEAFGLDEPFKPIEELSQKAAG